MNTYTAVMSLLGGVLLLLYAARLLMQKRNIVKNSVDMRAKLVDFAGKHAVYRFVHQGKTITAYSLQRTRKDDRRRNTLENIRFNPQSPKYVVIVGDHNVEWNAALMAAVGFLALLGGAIWLFL